MVASECAPVAQAGGLGEVVFGLSRELEWRGNHVEIVLPKYDNMRYDQIYGLSVAWHDLWVPWYGGAIRTTVWFGFVHGRRCFFIDPHSDDNFFNRGHFYGATDDAIRFAFLSKAALEFLYQSGRRPDVIHCHDWQTGLVPVLLYEMYQHAGMHTQRVCYTVHNFSHQGVAGENTLWATGLSRPGHFYHPSRLQDDFNPGAINLMKGGIVYSNFVTTVSPQHAWEATYTEQGRGLGHTLHLHHGKFGGVLNGVDYDVWNPEIDPLIPVRYSADDVGGKYAVKAALRDRLWLRHDYKPDRGLRRPARPAEGRAPDPPRRALRAVARRPVRAARLGGRARRSATSSGGSRATSTTTRTATSKWATTTSWRTWSTPAPTSSSCPACSSPAG